MGIDVLSYLSDYFKDRGFDYVEYLGEFFGYKVYRACYNSEVVFAPIPTHFSKEQQV